MYSQVIAVCVDDIRMTLMQILLPNFILFSFLCSVLFLGVALNVLDTMLKFLKTILKYRRNKEKEKSIVSLMQYS